MKTSHSCGDNAEIVVKLNRLDALLTHTEGNSGSGMIQLPKVVASFSVQKVSSKLRVFWVIQSKVERGNNLSSNKKRQNCLSPLISTEIIQLGLGQTWVPQMSELSDDSSKKLLVQEF